jgi:hypothetical protein
MRVILLVRSANDAFIIPAEARSRKANNDSNVK